MAIIQSTMRFQRGRSTTPIDSENSLSPLEHFTEYLEGVFKKLPPENNLDHKFSRLLTRWLVTHPAITCKNSITPTNNENDSLVQIHSNGATGLTSFLKNRTGESNQLMPLFCSENHSDTRTTDRRENIPPMAPKPSLREGKQQRKPNTGQRRRADRRS
jgi:hypothetical protein